MSDVKTAIADAPLPPTRLPASTFPDSPQPVVFSRPACVDLEQDDMGLLAIISGQNRKLMLDATDILKKFLPHDESPMFKSHHQELAVKLAMQGEQSFMLSLPTGGGKSIVIFAAAMSFPKRLVVVLVPTIALREQHSARLAALGLFVIDQDHLQSFELVESLVGNSKCVAVLTFSCIEKNLTVRSTLNFLAGVSRLSHLIVDEAHELVLPHYRDQLQPPELHTKYFPFAWSSGEDFRLARSQPIERVCPSNQLQCVVLRLGTRLRSLKLGAAIQKIVQTGNIKKFPSQN